MKKNFLFVGLLFCSTLLAADYEPQVISPGGPGNMPAEGPGGMGPMGGMGPGGPGMGGGRVGGRSPGGFGADSQETGTVRIVTFQLQNRPASEIVSLLQPLLRSSLAFDENRQILIVMNKDNSEESTIQKLLSLFDQPLPKVQPPTFQLNFYFIKCRINQNGISEEAVQTTWEKLRNTTIPDTALFKGSLRKAFNEFKARGVRVLVLWDALETEGISPDNEVKFQNLEGLKDITLKQVLEILVRTMGAPETQIGYAVDSDGMVVVSTIQNLPETINPASLPVFLHPIANSLVKNGFGNPELIAPFMIKSQEDGKFEAMGLLVGEESWVPAAVNEIPIWASIKGRLSPQKDGKSIQIDLHSTLTIQPAKPTTQPGRISLPAHKTEIFTLTTTTITSEGDYVILAGAPTGLMRGEAIALVIKVDSGTTAPTISPKALGKSIK